MRAACTAACGPTPASPSPPDGILRKGENTVSTGVTSAFAELDKDNYSAVTYVDGNC